MPLDDTTDFGLEVSRILTQAGVSIVDLSWRHVRACKGYQIYRAENLSEDPNDWFLISGSKLVGVNYFQDRGFAGGLPMGNERIAWYYKVIPVAQDGTPVKLSKSLAATFSEPLSGIQAFVIPTIRMRTNMMLDPKGFSSAEPVHFFVRKWAGELCHCVNTRTTEHDANCPQCFPAGTLVRSEFGWKPIEEIRIGEKVLSSDGSYQKVLNTFNRYYNGPLHYILPSISTNYIGVTPEHPILVMRGSHSRQLHCGPKCNSYIKSGDGLCLERPCVRQLPSGRWWARVQVNGTRSVGRVVIGTYATKEAAIEAIQDYRKEHYIVGHDLSWNDAYLIKKRDWLVTQWNRDIKDISEIKIPDNFIKQGKTGPKRQGSSSFIVDTEFLWVLGLYLAEGCAGKRSLIFALHRREIDYANRVVKLFNKYGYTTKIRHVAENGMVVYVYGSSISEWFPTWVGNRCFNKRIPLEFMTLPSDKLWAIIQGIYAGDNGEINEIFQTSECLAIQLVELLHRIGEQPLVRRHISKALTPKGNKRRVAYVVSWGIGKKDADNRKGRWIFKEHVLTNVKDVHKKQFSGLVYNIEVSGNHTYVVNGIVVHNCYGVGYSGGYALVENVFCRVRSAKRQIIADAPGISVSQLPTGIVASYPRLSDGDILVRAHNERYRIRNPKARKSQNYITAQFFEMDFMQLYDMGYRLTAPPIVPPVDRIEGGNVLGGVLARSEGNSLNGGRGGEAVRPGQITPEVSIVDGETKTALTTRTGAGVGRGYVGHLPSDYPP